MWTLKPKPSRAGGKEDLRTPTPNKPELSKGYTLTTSVEGWLWRAIKQYLMKLETSALSTQKLHSFLGILGDMHGKAPGSAVRNKTLEAI